MEPYSARVSPQSDQQAVPAARRPRPPRPLRPVHEPQEASEARPSRPPAPPGARRPRGAPGSAARTSGARGSVLHRALTRTPPKEALATAMSRLPAPRLTALGTGVLAVLLMTVIGALDALLLGASPATYGVFFLLVSAASAAWVRPADLYGAPVAAPLAYAAGLFFVSPGGEGFGSTVMGLVSGLSLQAGWVYGGTFLAGVIALVRRIAFVRRRRAERRARATAERAA
ncbi:hypothetical protein DVA86_16165 [Streptomyces armeniacus]|uniref:DUF6542 domain-containing protein n=1 Tax=Streptomyces armeniacus TaxID=83291 RepID=A0A345XQP9_9ACTN|nr:hypothetical protein DVA86_16165 [Streptomyces armeniacus]